MNELLRLPKLSSHLKEGQRFISPLTKLILIFAVISLAGCISVPIHDHYAYTQTIGLKVDALKLMDLAVEDFSLHEAEVDDFFTRIEKAYEYEKVRPKNEITVRMWEKLKDPDENLFGGFIKRWKEKNKLGKTFVEEVKKLVSDAFDQIIGYESGKIKKP